MQRAGATSTVYYVDYMDYVHAKLCIYVKLV